MREEIPVTTVMAAKYCIIVVLCNYLLENSIQNSPQKLLK